MSKEQNIRFLKTRKFKSKRRSILRQREFKQQWQAMISGLRLDKLDKTCFFDSGLGLSDPRNWKIIEQIKI